MPKTIKYDNGGSKKEKPFDTWQKQKQMNERNKILKDIKDKTGLNDKQMDSVVDFLNKKEVKGIINFITKLIPEKGKKNK